MIKPFVYVAGPITANPLGCVRESIPVFKYVLSVGGWPFMPQWSVLPEMIENIDYETWLAYDFDFISRCDALLRIPGTSPGADREVEYAFGLDKPVFMLDTDSYQFERWMARWKERYASSPTR